MQSDLDEYSFDPVYEANDISYTIDDEYQPDYNVYTFEQYALGGCSELPGLCSEPEVCQDSPNGPICVENHGLSEGNSQKLLTCSENQDLCPANSACWDLDEGFTCQCDPGYEMIDRECIDLNECDLGTHNCDKNADCLNRTGSFECLCHEEYVGNGVTCQRDPSILRTGSLTSVTLVTVMMVT